MIRVVSLLGGSLLALLAGCAGQRPAPPPSPLTVPPHLRAVAVSAVPEPGRPGPHGLGALPVLVRVHRCLRPAEGAVPLLQAARSLTRPDGARPIPTPPAWIRRGAVLVSSGGVPSFDEAPASEHALCWEGRAELAESSSLCFRLEHTEVIDDPSDFLAEYSDRGPVPRVLELTLRRSAGEPTFTVLVAREDAAPLPADERPRASAAGALVPVSRDQMRREVILLPPLSADRDTCTVWLLAPFADVPGLLAFEVRRLPLDESSPVPLVDLSTATPDTAELTTPIPDEQDPPEARAERRMAAQAAADPRARISALSFLGDRLDVSLARDLTALADDGGLDVFAEAVLAEDFEPLSLAAQSWRVERACYRHVLDRVEASEAGEPVLTALLLEHAGALGRFPSSLRELLDGVDSTPQWRERLRLENLRALEDSTPATRVRAHDWLRRRGAEVPGFDPLASRDERRAALAAAAESHR